MTQTARELLPHRDRTVRWLVLLLSISQAIAPSLNEILGLGRPIGGPGAELERTPLLPATYAFSIWFPIFAGCIAYAIWQLLPSRRSDLALSALAPLAALAFGVCTLWSIVAQFWINWLTVPIFVALLAFLLLGMAAYRREGLRTQGWRPHPLVTASFGVYAGWSSVAILANTSTVLETAGFSYFGMGLDRFSGFLVVVGGAILWWLTRSMPRNVWFAGAVLWAIVAIVIENAMEHQALGVSLLAGLLGVLIAIATIRAAPLGYPARRSSPSRP